MQDLPSTRKQAKELGLNYYFTGKHCKNGHLDKRHITSSICVSCGKKWKSENSDVISQRRKNAYAKNAEQRKEQSKKYHSENREAVLDKMKIRNAAYYQKNKDKIKAQALAYQAANPSKRTAYKNAWTRDRAAKDPAFKMGLVARRMLQRALGVSGQKKYKRTELYLGYTGKDLSDSLESKLQDGMSWANYGEWHIDHIKPVKAFIDEGVTDPAIINAIDNLQPLWASENIRKSSHFND